MCVLSSMCVLVASVVSDSLRPYRLQPARLFCPWVLLQARETGVGYYALLQGIFPTQGIKPKSLMSPALTNGFFTTSTPGKPVNQLCCFQSPSRIWLFVTPWTDCSTQASWSLTISQSLPKFISVASVMPFSHLIIWCPLFLLPSVFPSIQRVHCFHQMTEILEFQL